MRLLCALFALAAVLCADAKTFELLSPNKANLLIVNTDGTVTYSLKRNGRELVAPSRLSLTVGGEVWGENAKCIKAVRKSVCDTVVFTVPRKYRKTSDCYNSLTLVYKGYEIQFRAYDSGVAYRFVSTKCGHAPVVGETVEFRLADDWPTYTLLTDQLQNWFEQDYTHKKLSELPSDSFSVAPVMVDAGNCKMLLAEANLYHYPGMYLRPEGDSFKGVFAAYPQKEVTVEGGNKSYVESRCDYLIPQVGKRSLPWRVIGTFDNDAQILTDELVFLLSDAPDSKADFAWIQPGKMLWDWWNDRNVYGVDFESGINTATYMYLIDYAHRHGIENVLIDEGWSAFNDALKLNPEVDVPAICRYAADNGVGIALWVKWVNLRGREDEIFQQFDDWGVKGVKIDFMDRNDAVMVDFFENVAKKALPHHLMVDFHGSYPNEGMRRKYPHLMTREGVIGLEYNKWSKRATPRHDVTIPFTRMWLGPMDYTPGAMLNAHPETFLATQNEPMSQGTRSHQVAMYVVYESPLQMVSDSPTKYDENPQSFEFIKATPTVWDETVALDGKVGEYVVVARRSGDTWFVGALNGETPRDIVLDLDFVGDGDKFVVSHADGPNAHKQAKDHAVKEEVVANGHKINVHMAKGGGYAARITRL